MHSESVVSKVEFQRQEKSTERTRNVIKDLRQNNPVQAYSFKGQVNAIHKQT